MTEHLDIEGLMQFSCWVAVKLKEDYNLTFDTYNGERQLEAIRLMKDEWYNARYETAKVAFLVANILQRPTLTFKDGWEVSSAIEDITL